MIYIPSKTQKEILTYITPKTQKETLLYIIQNNSCKDIACRNCPGESVSEWSDGSRFCNTDLYKSSGLAWVVVINKDEVIKKFIECYGESALMEALL